MRLRWTVFRSRLHLGGARWLLWKNSNSSERRQSSRIRYPPPEPEPSTALNSLKKVSLIETEMTLKEAKAFAGRHPRITVTYVDLNGNSHRRPAEVSRAAIVRPPPSEQWSHQPWDGFSGVSVNQSACPWPRFPVPVRWIAASASRFGQIWQAGQA